MTNSPCTMMLITANFHCWPAETYYQLLLAKDKKGTVATQDILHHLVTQMIVKVHGKLATQLITVVS